MFRTFFPFHAVHPRLRGELAFFFCPKRKSCGSSPLTRGTLLGEKKILVSYGSSPLTRGTRLPYKYSETGGRFIPAYAGNSSFTPEKYRRPSVHPRLRGELSFAHSLAKSSSGSSPLTRGTHLKWLQHYTNRLTAKLLK